MNAPAPWSADPHVVWNVLLEAELDGPLPHDLAERLAALNRDLGSPSTPVVHGTDAADLRRQLSVATGAALFLGVLVGPDGRGTLVLSAHHAALDGLGMLGALARLTDTEVLAHARGLADRPGDGSVAGAMVRRLREVLLSPPDLVPGHGGRPGTRGDSTTRAELGGQMHTSELVHRTLQGVGAWNRDRGGRVRRPAVAIGASRVGGTPLRLGNHSALIRLTRMAGVDAAGCRTRLQQAAAQPDEMSGHASGLLHLATSVALRVLRRRLGSTVLVSHLGRVEAPMVRSLALYPVTGGGSGLSVGAVSLVAGDSTTTVVTARARGAEFSGDALARLLEGVIGDSSTVPAPDHLS